MTVRDLSAAKIFPSGAVLVGAMVNGQRVSRRYFGYSIRQAVAEFLAEFGGKQ